MIRGRKKLRFGYTTGSCAAAACKGAVQMLLGRKEVTETELLTPKGIRLFLELEDRFLEEDFVSCAVRKDGGDDPDTTNGLLIYAKAEKRKEPGIVVDGGIGVGRVTRGGLPRK